MSRPKFFMETSIGIAGEHGSKVLYLESNPEELFLKITDEKLPGKELIRANLTPDDCLQLIEMLCAIHKHVTGG